MQKYRAPIRDQLFYLNELPAVSADDRAQSTVSGDGTESAAMILEAIGKFAERELLPLNSTGDREGARWDNGSVTTPSGFKQAYERFVQAGWTRLGHPEEHGGQPVPYALKLAGDEILNSANQAWCIYTHLGDGALKTLIRFAERDQVEAIVPKLVSGEWTGTMCLTEPQCGSDLNLLRTRAEPTENGRYRIHGSKMFISSGEHDWTDNIVHLVLARLPDAPPGTRGISLFAVPKRLPGPDGTLGAINNVHCVSIEDKMGLKASATCSMAFDGAEGWMVGPPNRGLNCMFLFVNKSRLGVAVQGVAQAEAAYQDSLAYAHERLAGRAPGSAREPADALVAHADVRRMLLTQRAVAEGGRALAYLCAKWVEIADGEDAAAHEEAEQRLALLTPIAKGVLTELAGEATDLAIQIHGGHGYIKETGVEQRARDIRIARIYEGTTAIQAMDLLGRKVLGPQRAVLGRFIDEIQVLCARAPAAGNERMVQRLQAAAATWRKVTDDIADKARSDAHLVGAIAVDYLMLSGYVTLGYLWAQAAEVSARRLADSGSDAAFYRAKRQTAQFYFDKLLPRMAVHQACIEAGSEAMLNVDDALRLAEA
ncbi:acyl-CoA dehydrogenase C-terminal domain-containing protein [Ideonella sp. B508-1]|uniref:acyl-CoA dehydrogenase C-terminal domain-containing protein n=1 Tax=Ideonella sp. B508-1 TaxID=137716 RepID=UPI000349AA46|nr:acyl-CoA dehydrogenase C-terminal domain-containing protein [Ideonella sp. B508-1]